MDELATIGDQLDRLDARGAQIIAANEWPHKHPSCWLETHAVRRVMNVHHITRCSYYGIRRAQWLDDQEDIKPGKVTLAQVWQRWRAVLAARQEVEQLGVVTVFADDDRDPPIEPGPSVSTRERIDAMILLEAAEGLYDIVSRAFEGKQPRSWQERRARLPLKPPSRPNPNVRGKRGTTARSTYIGE